MPELLHKELTIAKASLVDKCILLKDALLPPNPFNPLNPGSDKQKRR